MSKKGAVAVVVRDNTEEPESPLEAAVDQVGATAEVTHLDQEDEDMLFLDPAFKEFEEQFIF